MKFGILIIRLLSDRYLDHIILRFFMNLFELYIVVYFGNHILVCLIVGIWGGISDAIIFLG